MCRSTRFSAPPRAKKGFYYLDIVRRALVLGQLVLVAGVGVDEVPPVADQLLVRRAPAVGLLAIAERGRSLQPILLILLLLFLLLLFLLLVLFRIFLVQLSVLFFAIAQQQEPVLFRVEPGAARIRIPPVPPTARREKDAGLGGVDARRRRRLRLLLLRQEPQLVLMARDGPAGDVRGGAGADRGQQVVVKALRVHSRGGGVPPDGIAVATVHLRTAQSSITSTAVIIIFVVFSMLLVVIIVLLHNHLDLLLLFLFLFLLVLFIRLVVVVVVIGRAGHDGGFFFLLLVVVVLLGRCFARLGRLAVRDNLRGRLGQHDALLNERRHDVDAAGEEAVAGGGTAAAGASSGPRYRRQWFDAAAARNVERAGVRTGDRAGLTVDGEAGGSTTTPPLARGGGGGGGGCDGGCWTRIGGCPTPEAPGRAARAELLLASGAGAGAGSGRAADCDRDAALKGCCFRNEALFCSSRLLFCEINLLAMLMLSAMDDGGGGGGCWGVAVAPSLTPALPAKPPRVGLASWGRPAEGSPLMLIVELEGLCCAWPPGRCGRRWILLVTLLLLVHRHGHRRRRIGRTTEWLLLLLLLRLVGQQLLKRRQWAGGRRGHARRWGESVQTHRVTGEALAQRHTDEDPSMGGSGQIGTTDGGSTSTSTSTTVVPRLAGVVRVPVDRRRLALLDQPVELLLRQMVSHVLVEVRFLRKRNGLGPGGSGPPTLSPLAVSVPEPEPELEGPLPPLPPPPPPYKLLVTFFLYSLMLFWTSFLPVFTGGPVGRLAVVSCQNRLIVDCCCLAAMAAAWSCCSRLYWRICWLSPRPFPALDANELELAEPDADSPVLWDSLRPLVSPLALVDVDGAACGLTVDRCKSPQAMEEAVADVVAGIIPCGSWYW
uniref:Uncharacterized protein n=1 Tax=Anopheles atroparvus TaxID=41427 RepID=A0A182JCV7_ANOAO